MWSPRTRPSPEPDGDARVYAEDILRNPSERLNESVMLCHPDESAIRVAWVKEYHEVSLQRSEVTCKGSSIMNQSAVG